jgi:hypothetical protein
MMFGLLIWCGNTIAGQQESITHSEQDITALQQQIAHNHLTGLANAAVLAQNAVLLGQIEQQVRAIGTAVARR